MTFHVGQRVTCVNVTPRRDGLRPTHAGTVFPKLGGVYTVRDIFDARPYGHDEPGLLLVEVVNPLQQYMSRRGSVVCEQFWLGFRFRPLPTTNIDVFKKMLEPAYQLVGFVSDADARRAATLREVEQEWERAEAQARRARTDQQD